MQFYSAKMKNLGEKLRAAREALGLSVRDVSEVTRIRTDFIENMECGNFSFKLPEIYKRGFLRIYAKFLKLDSDAIVAEYAAGALSTPAEEQRRKPLIPRKPSKIDPEIIDHPSRYEDDLQQESLDEQSKVSKDEQVKQYVKLGGVFVGVLLAVVVLVSVISALMRPSSEAENPDIALARNADVSVTPVKEREYAQPFELSMKALADTYVTAYYSDDRDKPLFTGSLEAGSEKTFSSKKPIMLILTDIDKVKLTRSPVPIEIPSNLKGYRVIKVTDGVSK